MAYAQAFSVFPENISSNYYSVSQLPGEVTSPSSHSHMQPQQYSTPKRRSSTSHSYSPYDVARSPTRNRAFVTLSNASTPYDASPPTSSGTHHHSSIVGLDRHKREHEVVETISRVTREKPVVPSGPSNHTLVPQSVFHEPATAKSFRYRYPTIIFQVRDFPEIGVKVRSMMSSESPCPELQGGNDLVLQDVKERELKIKILWPGYTNLVFEKRMKTLSGTQTRNAVALKLADIVLHFSTHLQQSRAVIDARQRQWRIDEHPSHENPGVKPSSIFITKLIHCGGSYWQMELWARRETS